MPPASNPMTRQAAFGRDTAFALTCVALAPIIADSRFRHVGGHRPAPATFSVSRHDPVAHEATLGRRLIDVPLVLGSRAARN